MKYLIVLLAISALSGCATMKNCSRMVTVDKCEDDGNCIVTLENGNKAKVFAPLKDENPYVCSQ